MNPVLTYTILQVSYQQCMHKAHGLLRNSTKIIWVHNDRSSMRIDDWIAILWIATLTGSWMVVVGMAIFGAFCLFT